MKFEKVMSYENGDSYQIKTPYGTVGITFFIYSDGKEDASVYGDIKASKFLFQSIHRMPPNKYGNFYRREKAGLAACHELIEKYKE